MRHTVKTLYYPEWTAKDLSEGIGAPRESHSDAIQYLTNRSKSIILPDISHRIRTTTIVETVEILK